MYLAVVRAVAAAAAARRLNTRTRMPLIVLVQSGHTHAHTHTSTQMKELVCVGSVCALFGAAHYGAVCVVQLKSVVHHMRVSPQTTSQMDAWICPRQSAWQYRIPWCAPSSSVLIYFCALASIAHTRMRIMQFIKIPPFVANPMHAQRCWGPQAYILPISRGCERHPTRGLRACHIERTR